MVFLQNNLRRPPMLELEEPKGPKGPGGLNVIRKEAWLSCRTSSGVRLCWELEQPKEPKGSMQGGALYLRQ